MTSKEDLFYYLKRDFKRKHQEIISDSDEDVDELQPKTKKSEFDVPEFDVSEFGTSGPLSAGTSNHGGTDNTTDTLNKFSWKNDESNKMIVDDDNLTKKSSTARPKDNEKCADNRVDVNNSSYDDNHIDVDKEEEILVDIKNLNIN